MEKWPKWLKYLVLIVFYGGAVALCLGGVTAIGGIPLGIAGVVLQRSMNLNIE